MSSSYSPSVSSSSSSATASQEANNPLSNMLFKTMDSCILTMFHSNIGTIGPDCPFIANTYQSSPSSSSSSSHDSKTITSDNNTSRHYLLLSTFASKSIEYEIRNETGEKIGDKPIESIRDVLMNHLWLDQLFIEFNDQWKQYVNLLRRENSSWIIKNEDRNSTLRFEATIRKLTFNTIFSVRDNPLWGNMSDAARHQINSFDLLANRDAVINNPAGKLYYEMKKRFDSLQREQSQEMNRKRKFIRGDGPGTHNVTEIKIFRDKCKDRFIQAFEKWKLLQRIQGHHELAVHMFDHCINSNMSRLKATINESMSRIKRAWDMPIESNVIVKKFHESFMCSNGEELLRARINALISTTLSAVKNKASQYGYLDTHDRTGVLRTGFYTDLMEWIALQDRTSDNEWKRLTDGPPPIYKKGGVDGPIHILINGLLHYLLRVSLNTTVNDLKFIKAEAWPPDAVITSSAIFSANYRNMKQSIQQHTEKLNHQLAHVVREDKEKKRTEMKSEHVDYTKYMAGLYLDSMRDASNRDFALYSIQFCRELRRAVESYIKSYKQTKIDEINNKASASSSSSTFGSLIARLVPVSSSSSSSSSTAVAISSIMNSPVEKFEGLEYGIYQIVIHHLSTLDINKEAKKTPHNVNELNKRLYNCYEQTLVSNKKYKDFMISSMNETINSIQRACDGITNGLAGLDASAKDLDLDYRGYVPQVTLQWTMDSHLISASLTHSIFNIKQCIEQYLTDFKSPMLPFDPAGIKMIQEAKNSIKELEHTDSSSPETQYHEFLTILAPLVRFCYYIEPDQR